MERPTDILVPVDFGPTSEGVIRYASLLAVGFGAKLHVLHVLALEAHGWSLNAAAVPRLQESLESEAYERLTELIRQEADQAAVRAEATVSQGVPFSEILRYADTHRVNLIVMGSHGMTSLREKIMVGSVAEKVVRLAHCPVVVVRHPPEQAAAGDRTASSPARGRS